MTCEHVLKRQQKPSHLTGDTYSQPRITSPGEGPCSAAPNGGRHSPCPARAAGSGSVPTGNLTGGERKNLLRPLLLPGQSQSQVAAVPLSQGAKPRDVVSTLFPSEGRGRQGGTAQGGGPGRRGGAGAEKPRNARDRPRPPGRAQAGSQGAARPLLKELARVQGTPRPHHLGGTSGTSLACRLCWLWASCWSPNRHRLRERSVPSPPHPQKVHDKALAYIIGNDLSHWNDK